MAKGKKVKCSRNDERHANRFAKDLIPLDLNTVQRREERKQAFAEGWVETPVVWLLPSDRLSVKP